MLLAKIITTVYSVWSISAWAFLGQPIICKKTAVEALWPHPEIWISVCNLELVAYENELS